MQELSQRTSQFTDSVIRRMTRVSMKHDAINLSQGFPDFDPPAAITDRLAEVAHTGPPSRGARPTSARRSRPRRARAWGSTSTPRPRSS